MILSMGFRAWTGPDGNRIEVGKSPLNTLYNGLFMSLNVPK